MDMQKPGPGKVIKYISRPRGSSRVKNPGGRPAEGGCWCLELTDVLYSDYDMIYYQIQLLRIEQRRINKRE